MNIDECYKILRVNKTASEEEIIASYKKLARQYHPDRNRDRTEWANDAMTSLNIAYTALKGHLFKVASEIPDTQQEERPPKKEEKKPEDKKSETSRQQGVDTDILINKFVKYRENAKDSLYRYFQYRLYHIPTREKISNMGIFNRIVFDLRKSYHSIKGLANETSDPELLEHFAVFTDMIYNFYKASECLNIIDSYQDLYEVEAYRLFKNGDEHLHEAHKEIFFDRHNRGYFKSNLAYPLILKADKIFRSTLKIFPTSTWAVETSIKLDYAKSLRRYIELFFTEDQEGEQ